MLLLKDLPSALQSPVIDHIRKGLQSPTLLMSKTTISYNYRFFKDTFRLNDNEIFYAVKANDHDQVISLLNEAGSGFEIASLGELELLKKHNIAPERILFSNPVKIPEHIEFAFQYGIKRFAFDSESELIRISKHAPGSEVYIRIEADNEGAEWEITGKFGAPPDQVMPLFRKAQEFNLNPAGITFHVGWNNTCINTWVKALDTTTTLLKKLSDALIPLQFINIGGGFPAHNTDPYCFAQQLAAAMESGFSDIRNRGVRIMAEPGSFIVTNAGVTATRITSVISRKNKTWVYIDTGICQGFYWIFSGLKYNIIYPYTENTGSLKEYIITGPTCDSHDVFSFNTLLPDNIKPGDFLLIFPAGGYINSAKQYNGFPYPEQLII